MNLVDFILTVSITAALGFVLGFFTKALITKIRQKWLSRQLSYFEKYKHKDDAL
ncbi:hypothetical protein [Photobacterium chitinilyticum]|uniref:hypothetical protein n=1 Tax=Photobacterium chitinilyticum TaxID=2485123 RepID=UPI0013E8D2B1|nr:hypothetical protein [Photobacterium chitinilyticum]